MPESKAKATQLFILINRLTVTNNPIVQRESDVTLAGMQRESSEWRTGFDEVSVEFDSTHRGILTSAIAVFSTRRVTRKSVADEKIPTA
jgi:hypothetical protein